MAKAKVKQKSFRGKPIKRLDPYNYPGKLDTEAQGRKFAIELLKEVERRQRTDEFSATAFGHDPIEPSQINVYRTGPQSRLIVDAFDVIYSVNEDSRRGFFTIITDYLGTAPSGHFYPEGYEAMESEGVFDDPAHVTGKGARHGD
jgi:hypothetical protein